MTQALRKSLSGLAVLCTLCCLFVLAFITQAQSQTLESPSPYRLQPGDVIFVGVLEDADLDRQVLLLPDGRISLPVAGTIMAAGKTPTKLEDIIRSRLRSNFVKEPTITVSVVALGEPTEDEVRTQEVYVLGEVASPGRYEYDAETPIDVLQALSLAGGLGPFAARDRIQVRERIAGAPQTLRFFDYEAVEDGVLDLEGDLSTLANSAVIVVPERGLFD
ncbi:MAG: polysaccharide biosynthesis/export family protein [Pseudomonadota bacterium]